MRKYDTHLNDLRRRLSGILDRIARRSKDRMEPVIDFGVPEPEPMPDQTKEETSNEYP